MTRLKPALQGALFLLRGGNRLHGCDDEHTARGFHLLLTVFLVWVGIMEFLVVPLFVVRKVAIAGLLLVMGGAALAALVLHRRGRGGAFAALFLSVVWCVAAGLSLLTGGVRSLIICLAIVVILDTAWLLGRSAALGVAAATLLLSFIEAFLQHAGHRLPLYFPGAPLAVWAAVVGIVLLAVGPILAILEAHQEQVSALRESEERYKALFDRSLECVFLTGFEGHLLDANQAALDLLGYRREDIATLTLASLLTEDQLPMAYQTVEEIRTTGCRQNRREYRARRKDGGFVFVETQSALIYREGKPFAIQGIARDITERKRAEEEKAKLQAQLHHAQKMESIGRLAGGVAHDFNNLLTVINGYSQLVLAKLSAGDPLGAAIAEIHKAGERAAGLTRQLLAFSRKQVLEPRVLDLNRVVEEMRPMLERLVGEDVEVRVALKAESATVHADPHQLEQVIMNLAVNARDAMPGGGKLLIETAGVGRDESYARSHPEARAGRYVMLAVSDTGVGMNEETRRHIFEPFFTTKEVGRGTGLGLSTVQGIVEQSGGYIDVRSEPGHGTTFTLYLPRMEDVAADAGMPEAVPAAGGKETVLVVEDQAEVRKYAAAALRAYGYQVIQAANADEALLLCEREAERIDLVLTDVVMPNLSGPELANRLEKRWPGIKVLFMSGYADDAVMHHGVLEEGTESIPKPFSPDQLAIKVREVMGAPKRRARILVADDEAGVRSFLRTVLEDSGYEVIEATDGKQALKQARAGGVDLAIMDLVMPEQEGIETIRALRRDVPGVGIIAISGAFGGHFLKTAHLLGADAVLNKPVSAELLLARVAEVLKPRR
jgi:PAS domain S-box-containing protein